MGTNARLAANSLPRRDGLAPHLLQVCTSRWNHTKYSRINLGFPLRGSNESVTHSTGIHQELGKPAFCPLKVKKNSLESTKSARPLPPLPLLSNKNTSLPTSFCNARILRLRPATSESYCSSEASRLSGPTRTNALPEK